MFYFIFRVQPLSETMKFLAASINSQIPSAKWRAFCLGFKHAPKATKTQQVTLVCVFTSTKLSIPRRTSSHYESRRSSLIGFSQLKARGSLVIPYSNYLHQQLCCADHSLKPKHNGGAIMGSTSPTITQSLKIYLINIYHRKFQIHWVMAFPDNRKNPNPQPTAPNRLILGPQMTKIKTTRSQIESFMKI